MNSKDLSDGRIRVQMEIETPMRDGVVLRADLYRPAMGERFPVLLMRTYYHNQVPFKVDWAVKCARAGYAVVLQDIRGRFDSDGFWRPYVDDPQDGHDTLQWIGSQPWCDGNIGTFGVSYDGFTSTLSAPLGSPCLKAMMPFASQEDNYGHIRNQGVLELWNAVNFAAMGQRAHATSLWSAVDIETVWKRLPLLTLMDDIVDRPFYRKVIEHYTFDDFWKSYSLKGKYKDVKAPAYNLTGWYDNLLHEGFKQFRGWSQEGGSPEVRARSRLLVGPWTHYYISSGGGVDYGSDLNFIPEEMVDTSDEILRWFDQRLKGIDTGIDDEPPLKLFVMGANVWRQEDEWPLPNTQFTRFYLHSGGRANSLFGDGVLRMAPPGPGKPDTYDYNPADPVPSWGGQIQPPAMSGPRDRRSVERRDDLLVYTSDPLQQDTEVTGPVDLLLYASSSAPDTDFTVTLVDVHPAGKATILCEGIVRARFRESVERPTLVEPGKIHPYHISLWETSNSFKAGHRIRVEVSSSNFPRFDRNLNTGNPPGFDAEIRVATQTIYHDRDHPSHIVLPIVPVGS